jgi:GntR family transcriptional regulator, transcriptional repressor for pyruvate dehydrogenase complex
VTGGGADDLFSPVDAGRAPSLIIDQVRLLIRDGKLSAGDRLPSERDLSERFGVSRVTVREALRGLEANGLIAIKVGARGGAFVTAPTGERLGESISDLLALSVIDPAELTEARQVFELGMIPVVCERADEQDVAELLAICDRADALLVEGQGVPVSLSAEFHLRVARASHNQVVEMFARSFYGPVLVSLLQALEMDRERAAIDTGEHREFVAAVVERDVAQAVELMSRHLTRTAERLRP